MPPEETRVELEPRLINLESRYTELKTDIQDLRSDFKTEMGSLEHRLTSGFGNLQQGISSLTAEARATEAGLGKLTAAQLITFIVALCAVLTILITFINISIGAVDNRSITNRDFILAQDRQLNAVTEDTSRLFQHITDMNQSQWMILNQIWQREGNPPLDVVFDSWPLQRMNSPED